LSFTGQYVENDLVRAKRPDFDPSILTIKSHLMFGVNLGKLSE
jgi:hypothetical protein